MDDQKRFGFINQADIEDREKQDSGSPAASSMDMVRKGQHVYLPGDQFIGLITNLLLNPVGQFSHLAIRTARLFGRHKVVPITAVSTVTLDKVLLSISREQFSNLPGFQPDSTIVEEVDREIWKDSVLRYMDYHEIDIRSLYGNITLSGHVISSMNQWRAEMAAKNVPGILSMKSYLIPDDKLLLEVMEALGQVETDADSKFSLKVEHGLAVLSGEVSDPVLRDQVEQCVANIPWVRGVINEIQVKGKVSVPGDFRFLQPQIGKELVFHDALSVTILKVIINPHNRLVVAVVVVGRFPGPFQKAQDLDDRDGPTPEQLVVLPVDAILLNTHSTGFLNINSSDTSQYSLFEPDRYISPAKDWLPPYPYCSDEVLFQA